MNSHPQRMRRGLALLLGLFPVWVCSTAAADSTAPDTSDWKCRFCKVDSGVSGNAEVGIIGVDDGSYRFGKYSGLYHSGLYPSASGELRYRNPDGSYLDLLATDLGLSSRSVSVDAGRQGLLELHGTFQDIPSYQYGDAQTPFVGAGSSSQGLPAGWVTGGSTAQMTDLPNSLAPIGIRMKREIYGLGLRFLPPHTHWSMDFNFRHDRQSGSQVTGANFLTTSSLLAAPVDYDTDQLDAGIGYQRRTWQLRFAYYGSFFHDADNSLVWSNPFTPYVSGADVGRMSTAPDNAFNQFSLSGSWQILPSTRIMASAAMGLAIQDDNFIPSTINPDLTTAALPRSDLGGHLDTGNYTVRLNSRPLRDLSLTAEYTEDRRDNKTPQAAYQQVGTDVYVGATRVNLPYSFDRSKLRLLADYRIASLLKLEAGGEGQRDDRSDQEVGRSYTTSVWGEARTTFASEFGASVKYLRSHRTVGDYQAVPTIYPAENPLLRKFDMADRIREQVRASLYYNPLQTLSFGLAVERNRDDYNQSAVGLTGDQDYNLNLSGNWTPTLSTSLYAYLTRQVISADQAGSQSGSVPDWYGHTSENVNSAGIGGQWKDALPKTDLGIDSTFSLTRETIQVTTGASGTPSFPDNSVHDVGVRLFSRYHLSPKSSVRFDYWRESYVTSDWALDNVEPATIPNVLSLGVSSPDYHINLFALSYRYEF